MPCQYVVRFSDQASGLDQIYQDWESKFNLDAGPMMT